MDWPTILKDLDSYFYKPQQYIGYLGKTKRKLSNKEITRRIQNRLQNPYTPTNGDITILEVKDTFWRIGYASGSWRYLWRLN